MGELGRYSAAGEAQIRPEGPMVLAVVLHVERWQQR